MNLREIQDPNDVFVRVSEADLVRIPEFLEMLGDRVRISVFGADDLVVELDSTHSIWVGENGYDQTGNNYQVHGELPIDIIQEFMVKYMNANPDTVVERLYQGDGAEQTKVFKQRTVDNYLVECERYIAYHKSFTPTEKNLARHKAFVDETSMGSLWNEDAIADNLGGAE